MTIYAVCLKSSLGRGVYCPKYYYMAQDTAMKKALEYGTDEERAPFAIVRPIEVEEDLRYQQPSNPGMIGGLSKSLNTCNY